jgi:hypothetical protein
MKGKTVEEAKAELVASGMSSADIDHILPHKVSYSRSKVKGQLYQLQGQ